VSLLLPTITNNPGSQTVTEMRITLDMSKKKRKPNVKAVINASLEIAREHAAEVLRTLERIDKLEGSIANSPAPCKPVAK